MQEVDLDLCAQETECCFSLTNSDLLCSGVPIANIGNFVNSFRPNRLRGARWSVLQVT